MELEQRRLIKKNLDILLRHKKLIIICLLVSTAFGLGLYLKMPKVYKCAALIKYERQSVNPTVMSPDDLRTRTKDVVDTISQQIMSRASLESLIEDFDLYTEMQNTIPMEDIVDVMRTHHIDIQLLQGGDVFEVSYLGMDQEKVLQVTNALAARFIEENLRFRQERASQTSAYILDELKMAKEALDKKELIMRDYKLQYYNEMSDQLANNMSRLNALQGQYQNNQNTSPELERTRLLVQEQISIRQGFRAQLSSETVADTPRSASSTGGLTDINQLRLKLKNLQAGYTDNHPEVKRLKKIIQNLETQQGTIAAEDDKQLFDPQTEKLRQQLKDLEFTIDRLREERKELEAQIGKYEKWIAAAPIREAEWSALTRDYDQLNEHYQRLVTQSLQAESAQSVESQLKGSQFKIIDSAYFPEKPFKPNFKKIMLLAVGLGLAVGGGLAISVELLNTSFKDPVGLETYLDVPVVSAVPLISTKKELRKIQIMNIVSITILILATAAILAAIVYFWMQGMIIV